MSSTNLVSKICLAAGVSLCAVMASSALADKMPVEQSMSTLEYELLSRGDLWTYKKLDGYSEAPFLNDLVKAGKLPPVEERLPAEPLVMKTMAMSDGIGVYGGVFRHVIGGRPEGWNWLAGQHQAGVALTWPFRNVWFATARFGRLRQKNSLVRCQIWPKAGSGAKTGPS